MVGDEDTLAHYDTICVDEMRDNEVNRDISKNLNVNHQKIIHETEDLQSRVQNLTVDQFSVYQYVKRNQKSQKLMFITRPWGVRKSYLLHTIIKLLELCGEIVEVTATSSSAAKLVNGRTLHSFLSLGCQLMSSIKYDDQTWRSITATDTLIVDEVSMMSAELFEKTDEIFRACTEEDKQDKPFGWKNILLFGDLHQLPSVETPDTPWQVYNSPLWSKFSPFLLTQNCQQTDPTFKQMLERIRIGDIGEPDILLLESQICGKGYEHNVEYNDYSSPGVMVMCSKIEQRDNANRQIMEATLKHQPHHWFKSCDYEGSGRRATFHESEEVDFQKCVLPRYPDIRIGAKVSIMRNLIKMVELLMVQRDLSKLSTEKLFLLMRNI